MNPLPVIKTVVCAAAGIGAGTIIGNVVKSTTPVNIGPIHKVLIAIGSYGLGSAAGALASRAISDDIDEAENLVRSIADQND